MPDFTELSAKGDLFHVGIKAVLTNESGEILILRKAAEQAHGGPFWDLPGGRVQGGDPEATLRREVLEETGIQEITVGEPLGSSIKPAAIQIGDVHIGLTLLTYRCTVPGCPVPLLSDEHTSYAWLPVPEALDKLHGNFPDSLFRGLR